MFAKHTSIRSAGASALVAALLCMASAGAVVSAHAQGAEGRDYRRGDRPESGERAREPRTAPAPAPSNGDGGHLRRGDIERGRGGDGHREGGGYGGRGDRDHGGYRDRGGSRHGGGYGDHWRHRDYPRRHVWRSRPIVRLNVGWGYPYYHSPRYRHYYARRPVVRTYVPEIQVDNYPPAGCYYWDPYCDHSFESLDEYTEHLDGANHDELVEILDADTGEYVRTLELVGGYWGVRR